MASGMPTEAVTLCQCDSGVVAVHDGGVCYPEKGNMEEVRKRYCKADVWFLQLDGINAAMLVYLARSPLIQGVLEDLRTEEPGRRCSYIQLFAIDIAQRAVVLEALRETGNWRADLVSLSRELAAIAESEVTFEKQLNSSS